MKPENKYIVFVHEGGEKLDRNEFLTYFEKKVRKTVRINNLIGKKEKILVACSGGKDSTTTLYLLHKFARNRNVSVEALHIDVSIGKYSEINKKNITEFCKDYAIPLHITSFREEFGSSLCYIKEVLHGEGINWKSCAICGILKRYVLNKVAKRLNATKIATGHNLDDEAQSILMNLFKNNVSLLARLGPKSGVAEFEGFIPRIKPLYMCSEDEVALYSRLMDFPVKYDDCPCRIDASRKEVGEMIDAFDVQHKGTKYGIVNSYLELSPILKKAYKGGSVKICKSCGEPSAGEICNTCKILKIIKKPKQDCAASCK
jgi:uncharacterized protein (TIGR00269 family)